MVELETPAEGKKKRRKKPLPPDERDARAALILGAKIAGQRIDEIAAEFNISRATAYRELDKAKRQGLIAQARDFLTLNLVPLALYALETQLKQGNLDAALHVLDSIGVTGKNSILTLADGGGGDDFEEVRLQLIQRRRTPGAIDITPLPTVDSAEPPPAGTGTGGSEPVHLPALPEGAAAAGARGGEAGLPD